MNWQVFTALSTLQVQIHWMAAVTSLVFGLMVLARKKGTPFHRFMGRAFVFSMVVTSLSAFFVRNVEENAAYSIWADFSAIHLLIPFTLFYLFLGIRAIRRGDVKAHKFCMIFTFVGGIGIAGAFTFLPGRHMHSLFFGDPAEIQYLVDEGYQR